MLNFWRDLSVSKKLYAVVGIMAVLIATELFTLLFAMNVLTAVRSFVGGEGLWSKGQKNAVHSLHRYAFTRESKYYEEFHHHLQINMGDRQARVEMAKPKPDMAVVSEGFIKGGNHPDDVPGLIWLISKFYWVDPIKRALVVWSRADGMINQLLVVGDNLHKTIAKGSADSTQINLELIRLDQLNERLTAVENEFSEILGAGSRWMENLLMIVLILAVLTVESTGVFLTVAFSRNLNRALKELTFTAAEIGRGQFDVRLPVRSRDELGQLAASMNKMSEDLKTSVLRRVTAESASQVKSQFLANMSHEIRTPLGVMLGLTEILKDPKLTWQEQMTYVATIERTGKNLTRIINDILDLSKVEAGHLDIEKSRFILGEFISELESMLTVQAAKTGNALVIRGLGALPAEISTDRTRLRQILVNLVNNALKYTDHGTVELSYRRDAGFLIFEVRDDGRGIEDSERAKLFEAFVRAENPEKDRGEGTGLGLMLSKRLARALGGDVMLVESEPGVGSVFRATIALERSSEAPKISARSASGPAGGSLSGKKILVIEDSEDNQLLVKLLLTRAGMHSEFANNGEEGMAKALSNPEFDAILMDMQMPVLDGYRTTEELRRQGYRKPVIALTAHAMKEDRERCLKAGCSDYLTKPVDSKVLLETLQRHIYRPEVTV